MALPKCLIVETPIDADFKDVLDERRSEIIRQFVTQGITGNAVPAIIMLPDGYRLVGMDGEMAEVVGDEE